MILITGGCGFIGSNVVEALNKNGEEDILICDDLDASSKWKNLNGRSFADLIDRHALFKKIRDYPIKTVVHLGACTDTTEKDISKMIEANYSFSKKIWSYCTDQKLKLIYASSAAVYGSGVAGFNEDCDLKTILPLNLYGFSKLIFDRYAEGQKKSPPVWAGLRFFNVYGPGESHKGKMASIVYQMYHQIQESGKVRLFKSYQNDYTDGGQMRDFVSVKDVSDIITFLINKNEFPSGFYNVGTGEAHSFNELSEVVFAVCHKPATIEYIEMPEDLQHQYQYYTKSDITKLRNIGFSNELANIHDGINAYIKHLLN